jgi:uncharacterized repeat protein (TIGR04076 family)
MCQLRLESGKPVGKDRREFCRCSGLAFGAVTFSCLTGMAYKEVKSGSERMHEMAERVTAVVAKVISVKGTCSFGHKVGDTAKISESGVDGKICIHALYSMFPAAFAMLYDARFPWLTDPDRKTHPCTDAQNPVVFELTKIRSA